MRCASWRPFQNLRSRTALRCGSTPGSVWFTSKDAMVWITKNSTNAEIWTQVGYFSDTPRTSHFFMNSITSSSILFQELFSLKRLILKFSPKCPELMFPCASATRFSFTVFVNYSSGLSHTKNVCSGNFFWSRKLSKSFNRIFSVFTIKASSMWNLNIFQFLR